MHLRRRRRERFGQRPQTGPTHAEGSAWRGVPYRPALESDGRVGVHPQLLAPLVPACDDVIAEGCECLVIATQAGLQANHLARLQLPVLQRRVFLVYAYARHDVRCAEGLHHVFQCPFIDSDVGELELLDCLDEFG